MPDFGYFAIFEVPRVYAGFTGRKLINAVLPTYAQRVCNTD